MSNDSTRDEARKEYFPPKIVHTETITTRAVQCTKSDDTCGAGPIQS